MWLSCLTPDLIGNSLNFSLCFCCIWTSLYWGMFPLYQIFMSYYHRWMLNLSKAFSASILRWYWFLFLSLLMWCITLLDLWIVSHPCILWINPIWSWCIITLMFCWIQFANILLRTFASMSISNNVLLIYFCFLFPFFFLWCLWCLWYQNDAGLIKWVWKHSFLFIIE